MMNNLFSIFDPYSSIMNIQLNWLSSTLIFLFLPLNYWLNPSRFNMMFIMLFNFLNNEINNLMKSNNFKGNKILFVSLFMMILFNNFLGLFPYIFTSTSHLIFNLSFSLPIWLSLMFFGWLNKTQNMFKHLIPTGTPPLLMPFMVLIETTSNMIRPGTLAIRLTANMIAGHLLITLLSQNGSMIPFFFTFFLVIAEIMLLILEISVSVIQTYVFTILSSLYTSEIH
uniref:ATP synthase subunit a n=2 Tax=Cheumatopsyche TaxID=177865 RepID=A0A3G1ND28_9NEOP|nr:ATP synthase F0 subunit 6 [Cheumatopsyche campyla]YP_009459938.1 ATP synthase F0 subunit 6 [Cheumatopsyche analis]AUT18190.1 ATP synthase F0 subunit 6 [Cheumatopsyche campyla]AUT18203.1 ATP synthase F0 subunit 6 [Cheumatopsyche analis]